jgi:hypothetical protein
VSKDSPDIVAMFTIDKPGNYMIAIEGVHINYDTKMMTYDKIHLIPLDELMKEENE